MHSSLQARSTNSFLGSVPSRPRPSRDHHHRQLPYVLHLPPSARRPHQQLVLRRPRQRTSRSHPRPRRPSRLASPRCQPGAGRGIMTLVKPSSPAAPKTSSSIRQTGASSLLIKRRLHKFTIQFVVGIRLRVRYTLVIRILINLILPYPPRPPAFHKRRQSVREQGNWHVVKRSLEQNGRAGRMGFALPGSS